MARPVVREDSTSHILESAGFSNEQKKVLKRVHRALSIGKVVNTATTVASSTTLADVDQLSFNVKKGKKYRIHAVLYTGSTGATGGIKVALTHSGQSSPTFEGVAKYFDASTPLTVEALSSGSATGKAAAVKLVEIEAVFIPDANGTIKVQMAQNTSNGTGAVVSAGSFCRVHRA